MGRPSIDPELMVRMLVVGYVFAIRSERLICREVQVNLAYPNRYRPPSGAALLHGKGEMRTPRLNDASAGALAGVLISGAAQKRK
jgi:hypothetical protein